MGGVSYEKFKKIYIWTISEIVQNVIIYNHNHKNK